MTIDHLIILLSEKWNFHQSQMFLRLLTENHDLKAFSIFIVTR